MPLFAWISGAFSIGTQLLTRRRGERVGEDEFGKTYFRDLGGAKSPIGFDRERRRVIYDPGEIEASRAPPGRHAWLHHIVKDVPEKWAGPPRGWQLPHQPNLTGTALAYRPPGHTRPTRQGDRRQRAFGGELMGRFGPGNRLRIGLRPDAS